MLTERQQGILQELGDTRPEREIRAIHKKMIAEYGAVKDFTQWLVKRLHRQWAEERRRTTAPYLGD